ncbi:hypothetical protein [Bradyrhizobium diazoefficiens]|uniref:Uncharacterized protein n=1 Tax=Bradyrhizobium diazoefficiens TaxID=1355477 RepID=A0A809X0M9_9BRAD|nr:hypothetical protein [Bradyrhizobium diazoefficiens]AND87815.1 hypothetical protein AAV28_08380 [Bradyrhizobium diazoefficiens USDA 110]QLD45903.1 hypothetical protein HUW42_35110 [Bradyrhizobium diazoefficiens]WLA72237.1 hypothetical protein QIH77_35935 [Bradyrhizobium diazoefficiens]BBZ92747.1 hypothetical protein F07S3_25800 [Bradyrhizobium diazoefficiens]BCA10498.1 hypothetical protein BDHF08_23450 [Bradyrhizobium diazoefficiens]
MKGVPAKRAAKSSATKKDSKSKRKRTEREHDISLADLFLWVTVVDQCQIQPRNGLEATSEAAKLNSGQVQKRLKVIEKRFGPLFRKRIAEKTTAQEENGHAARKQNRSGVTNTLGGALAEIFATIEHLYLYALTLKRRDGAVDPFPEVIEAKKAVLKAIPVTPLRELDRVKLKVRRDRITRSQVWAHRIRQRQRTGTPKRFSDLPKMHPRYASDWRLEE